MARLPRLTLPGHVHHVLQRGNNGQAIFLEMADYQRMLALLAEYAPTLDVAVHAYLLMPGSLHLLATPGTADGLPALMQAVGRRYVRYFNDTHGRTGTLWDGRFRSTPVQAERYLLPSMVWLDTAPVAAGLVTEPTLYPWSSCGFYSGVRSDRLPKPHALFWALGNTPFAREAAYAELVHAGVSAADGAALADAVPRGWALGDAEFLADLQKTTARRVGKLRAGRPKSKPDSE